MKFKRMKFFPVLCPKLLLPLWWIFCILFYVIYIPIFIVIWLILPVKRKKAKLFSLDAEYRRDRH